MDFEILFQPFKRRPVQITALFDANIDTACTTIDSFNIQISKLPKGSMRVTGYGRYIKERQTEPKASQNKSRFILKTPSSSCSKRKCAGSPDNEKRLDFFPCGFLKVIRFFAVSNPIIV